MAGVALEVFSLTRERKGSGTSPQGDATGIGSNPYLVRLAR